MDPWEVIGWFIVAAISLGVLVFIGGLIVGAVLHVIDEVKFWRARRRRAKQ